MKARWNLVSKFSSLSTHDRKQNQHKTQFIEELLPSNIS